MKAESKHPILRIGKLVALGGCWVISVVTLCAILARHVSPEFFWMFQLFAVVLPYLAVLSVLCTVIGIGLRNTTLAVVQVVLLMLLLIRFFPSGGGETAGSQHPISIVSYNSPYPQSRVSPENEAEFRKILSERDPNIFAFQETFLGYLNRGGERVVGRGDVMNVLEPAGFEIARPIPKEDILFYQPVLSNVPVDSTDKIILADNPFPIESEILRIRFQWEGKSVVLYNIHLASYGASKPWHEENSDLVSPGFWLKYYRQYRRAIKARAWEARKIREMIDHENDGVIIAGDFNATRHNWSYKFIRGDFSDAYESVGEGPRMTYHSKYPFARIDHILFSDHFKAVESEVLLTDRSDHRAIWARLVMSDRP